MGEMAGIFFNDFGRILFFLCLAIYLYGDLSIYSAVVAKTLRDVIWYDIMDEFVSIAYLTKIVCRFFQCTQRVQFQRYR